MRWSGLMVMSALGSVGGCIGFNGDVGVDEGFFEDFSSVVVAQRSLKVNLDDTNPVQRFLLPLDVSPFAGDAAITVSVVSITDAAISGDLNTVGFASSAIDDWFSFGLGIPLQAFPFQSPQDFVLGLGTYTPPVSVELQLTLTAPADANFDGVRDDVVGTIGDLQPVR